MPPRLADLSADLDALYRAPLAEFIERRNALSARVKAEQGKEPAAAIKAMGKPSGTAWVVNQLFWRDARDFERLMKAGEQLRAVQQARLAGHEEADMHAAREARQTALSALMARVPDLLAEAGLSSSHAMRQRVSTTLEALSIYGGREPGPRPGRLTEDVDPPGFGTLAALVPASGGSPFSFAAALAGSGPAGKASGPSAAKTGGKPVPAHAKAKSHDDADDEVEAEAEDGTPAGGETAKKGSAASGGGAAAARPKLRAIDTRRMAEAKSAFDQAEADAAEAQSTSDAAESARQKAEAAWQRAKTGLDAAQKALDEAMEWEREAMELRDASRKAATAARQAADRAGRTRDQAERAYEESRGR